MSTLATRSLWLLVTNYLPDKVPSFWRGQLIGLACAAAGALVRFALEPLAQGGPPVVAFYPFILMASVFGGTFAEFPR